MEKHLDEWVNLSYNVAWLRKKYSLSKKEMASRLRIGVKTLNRIENGEIVPKLSAGILFEIYEQFGIAPNIILEKHIDG